MHRLPLLTCIILLLSTTLSLAESRPQFCGRMYTLCTDTCPPGKGPCTSCTGKREACLASGCFDFIRTGRRCESDNAPSCSENRRRCVMQGGNEARCDQALASCMRTGRWISLQGKDFGPAQKQ